MMVGMARLGLPALALLAVAACGGKLVPDMGDAGAPAASGEGMTNGTDPTSCSSQALAPSRACVPGKGRERSAIAIEIDRPGACLPCGGSVQPCTVDVQGTQITVSTTVQICGDAPATCSCASEKATCELPPLPSGTYTLLLPNEAPRPGLPPRQLVIQPSGEVACSLSDPGNIASVELANYGTSCQTDADCTLVTTGDSCTPCACPNGAISTKSQGRYESDTRAASSQCDGHGGVACAGCPQRTAFCNPSGVCDITP